MGRIVKSKIDKIIESKLSTENVLVTDVWRVYKTYSKDKGLEHYRIKLDDGDLDHIQNMTVCDCQGLM